MSLKNKKQSSTRDVQSTRSGGIARGSDGDIPYVDSDAQFIKDRDDALKELSNIKNNSKIEKYQSARKALSSAQDKMMEIDELLRKIRETRMREEQELAAWEKEVVSAKTKIQEVSQNLFERA